MTIIRLLMLISALSALFVSDDVLLAIVSTWVMVLFILLAIFFAIGLATLFRFIWILSVFKMKSINLALNFTFKKLFSGGPQNER